MDLDELLAEIAPDWSTDGMVGSELLICPCGNTIEQDGICPEGCVSPLRELGYI